MYVYRYIYVKKDVIRAQTPLTFRHITHYIYMERPVHIFLTVPHCMNDAHINTRHCDRTALRVAQLLEQAIRGLDLPGVHVTVVPGTTYRSQLDLNRPIARMSTWRCDLRAQLQRCMQGGNAYVIVMDIHSFDKTDCSSSLLPPGTDKHVAFLLDCAGAKRSSLSSARTLLMDVCQNQFDDRKDAVGLYRGSAINDIVSESQHLGAHECIFLSVNESADPADTALLAAAVAQWIHILYDAQHKM